MSFKSPQSQIHIDIGGFFDEIVKKTFSSEAVFLCRDNYIGKYSGFSRYFHGRPKKVAHLFAQILAREPSLYFLVQYMLDRELRRFKKCPECNQDFFDYSNNINKKRCSPKCRSRASSRTYRLKNFKEV